MQYVKYFSIYKSGEVGDTLTLRKWQSQRVNYVLTKEGQQNPTIHNSEKKGNKVNKIQSTQTGTLRLLCSSWVEISERIQSHKYETKLTHFLFSDSSTSIHNNIT